MFHAGGTPASAPCTMARRSHTCGSAAHPPAQVRVSCPAAPSIARVSCPAAPSIGRASMLRAPCVHLSLGCYRRTARELDEGVSGLEPEGVERYRALCEEGVAAAGLHYAEAGKLWEQYRRARGRPLGALPLGGGPTSGTAVNVCRCSLGPALDGGGAQGTALVPQRAQLGARRVARRGVSGAVASECVCVRVHLPQTHAGSTSWPWRPSWPRRAAARQRWASSRTGCARCTSGSCRYNGKTYEQMYGHDEARSDRGSCAARCTCSGWPAGRARAPSCGLAAH